jgi:arylsulfatase A-like enzyme
MPPNTLWSCTDQHRYDALGPCDTTVETPTLDGLAADSVRFDRTYCQSPVCTPSRANFLTSRYPRTTGCRQNGQSMPRDERLMTAALAEADDRCGLVGKLHRSPTNPDDPTDSLGRAPARRPARGRPNGEPPRHRRGELYGLEADPREYYDR